MDFQISDTSEVRGDTENHCMTRSCEAQTEFASCEACFRMGECSMDDSDGLAELG